MNEKLYEIYDPFVPTLLMSIHKEYVSDISNGSKVIEYRKSFFKDKFQAFVYTSGKDGGIELYIECDFPIYSDAKKLAAIGSIIQKDDYKEIFDYFHKKNEGYIIPIMKVYKIKKIDLAMLRSKFGSFNVPQKYTFLDKSGKKEILNYLLNQKIIGIINNDWDNYYNIIENNK